MSGNDLLLRRVVAAGGGAGGGRGLARSPLRVFLQAEGVAVHAAWGGILHRGTAKA